MVTAGEEEAATVAVDTLEVGEEEVATTAVVEIGEEKTPFSLFPPTSAASLSAAVETPSSRSTSSRVRSAKWTASRSTTRRRRTST